MELRHVRVFLALSEELNFGRAAARMHVVQSAISQTLKDLEVELGAALFVRSRRGVALTAAGTRFLEHARRASDDLAAGALAARRSAQGDLGRLRVAFTTLGTMSALPRAIAAFAKEAPEVEILLEQAPTPAVVDRLERGACDLGVLVDRNLSSALEYQELVRENVVVILPSRHPLARRQVVNVSQLHGEPMLMISSHAEPVILKRISEFFAAHDVRPRVVLHYDQLEAALPLVSAGLGLALGPTSIAQLRYPGAVVRRLAPREEVALWCAWKSASLSPVAKRFLSLLGEKSASAHRR